MAIYTGKMGVTVADNPLTDSLYVVQFDIGNSFPPPPFEAYMITETGIFMQTETGNNLMIVE